MAVEELGQEISLRETEVEDWPAIAALLGRGPADGRRLRQQVQQTYDPWFSFVAELPAGAPTSGNEIAGAGDTPIVGTVVAGVPRGRSDDPERQGEGRILWLGVTESRRRRRLGRRLLDLALDELRYRRLRRVALLVDGTQTEALALFRQAGFSSEGQTLSLLLPAERVAGLPAGPRDAGGDGPGERGARNVVRALALDDVPLLSGLLIQLAVERAQDPHDELEALSPAQVEDWLQRPGTVGFAAWDAADRQTPVGIAWASRRPDDAALRFIGVDEDRRRRGLGTALLAALGEGTARPPGVHSASAGGGGTDGSRFRPLRVTLRQPGPEQAFFRALGFEAEQVTYAMAREL